MNTLTVNLKADFNSQQLFVETKNEPAGRRPQIVKGWLARIVFYRITLFLLIRTILKYRSFRDIRHVTGRLMMHRNILRSETGTIRYVKASGKIFSTMYAPGFPSKAFSRMYDFEMERILPTGKMNPLLRFIFLAITSKCRLKCEHCFES